MDEKYISDLYNQLGGKSVFGEYADFKSLINTDDSYASDVYNQMGGKAVFGEYSDFRGLTKSSDTILQKKNVITESPSEVGSLASSASAKPEMAQFGYQPGKPLPEQRPSVQPEQPTQPQYTEEVMFGPMGISGVKTTGEAPEFLGKSIPKVIGEIGKVIAKGIVKFPSDTLETAAIVTAAAKNLAAKTGIVDETSAFNVSIPFGGVNVNFFQAAGEWENLVNDFIPTDKDIESGFWGQTANALGQMVPILLTGGLAGGAKAIAKEAGKKGLSMQAVANYGKNVVSRIGTPQGAITISQVAAPSYEQAKLEGATENEAIGYAIQNAVMTFPLEMLPVNNLFKRLDNVLVGNTGVEVLKRAVVGGGEELITEGVQAVYENVTADAIYGTTRGFLDGVGESAAVGGTVGAIMNGVLTALIGRRARATSDKEIEEIDKSIKDVEQKIVQVESNNESIRETVKVLEENKLRKLSYGSADYNFIESPKGDLEYADDALTEEQAQGIIGNLANSYKKIDFTIEQVEPEDPYQPTTYKIIGKPKPTQQDAIQEQAAGQVPVQPTTTVGQEVEQGVSQAEPQVAAEAGVQEEINEEDIALSGLRDGFQSVTRNSFDVRSDADVMQKVGSKKSFATSVTRNGKKYLVVGLRLNQDVGATTSGRDGYSFATIEDNGNLPTNTVDVLTQKAVSNISSIYRNINNPTIDLFKPIENIAEPQVAAQQEVIPASIRTEIETIETQRKQELERNRDGLDGPYLLGDTGGQTLGQVINQKYDTQISELKARTTPEPVIATPTPAPVVAPTPEPTTQLGINDLQLSFAPSNVINVETGTREDTSGRKLTYKAAETSPVTDKEGTPIGFMTKRSDSDGKLSFTVKDSKERNINKGKAYPTERDARVALVEQVNKQRTKTKENEQVQSKRTRDGRGPAPIRKIVPLQGSPTFKGAKGPDPKIVRVAEDYAAKNGIELKRQAEYVEVDEQRAKRIADAYEQMPDDPKNPTVREAYENLIKQTMAQYQALVDAGYKFWFIDTNIPSNDEYASSPMNAIRDLRQNKEMGVFSTTDGYGTTEITAEDIDNNPLLAGTGLQWPVGGVNGTLQPVLANDLFRAVHDAFGHGLEGAGFRARGEENAWQAHVRLFTGSAIPALTSETRGQNSYVNFGPNGETNRTATPQDTQYAPQKIGLMPEFTWTEGRAPDMKTEATAKPVTTKQETKTKTPEAAAQEEGAKKLPVKIGVPELFETNPELASVGTQEQYSDYLDTIFPDSQVKDIVYHGSNYKFEKFKKGKNPKNIYNKGEYKAGFFFAKDKNTAKSYIDNKIIAKISNFLNISKEKNPTIYPILLNIQNPITENRDGQRGVGFDEVNQAYDNNNDAYIAENVRDPNILTDVYIVFDPEKIHILGNKNDIQDFKNFVKEKDTIQEEEIEGKLTELSALDPKDKGTGKKVLDYLDGLIKDYEDIEKKGINLGIALSSIKEILKGIRALVQAGITLSDAIKQAAKENNISVKDITDGINALNQIIPIQAGFNTLMNKADALIARQKSRGIEEKKIVSNLDTMVRKEPAYINGTDAQRKIMEREARARMEVEPRKAASIGRVLGVLKDIANVTREEKLKIISRIRELGRDVAKDLTSEIRQMAKGGTITPNQSADIIARFGKVNMLNEKSVSNFVDYMAKVFANAEYNSQLKDALSTKKRLKSLSKNKDKAANLKALASKFVEIDPTMVEDIYEYNRLAKMIEESVAGSSIRGKDVNFANIVQEGDVIPYINKTLDAQKETLFEEKLKEVQDILSEIKDILGVDAKDLSYEDLLTILSETNVKGKGKDNEKLVRDAINKAFDVYSSVIKSIIKTGVDPFSGQDVNYTDSQKKIISDFMDMDLNIIPAKQALEAVDAALNFLQNKSTAKMTAIFDAYMGEKNARELVQKGVRASALRKYFSPGLARFFGEQTTNLGLLFERLFKGFEAGGLVQDMMGLTNLINGKSQAQNESNGIINDYVSEFYKKKANGEAFNTEMNNVERGMAAFLMRNVIGTEAEIKAEFKRRKDLIKESIEELGNGNEKEVAKSLVYQDVYDKILKDAKTIDDIISKVDAVNLGAVKFWQNQWQSKYDELSDVSLNVYNKVLEKDINYTPDRYGRLSTSSETVEITENDMAFNVNNGTLYKKETGVLMEATRPNALPIDNTTGEVNRYIDLSFDSNNANSMYDALVDIKTAGPIRQVQAFLNSKSFKKIFPKAEDAVILKGDAKNKRIGRIELFTRNFRNKNPYSEDEFSSAVRNLNRIANVGVSQALGGIFQPVKQVIPAAMNTLINGGSLDFNAMTNPDKIKFMMDSGYAIGFRGIESQAQVDSLNKLMDMAAKSKGEKAIKYIEEANKIWLKVFLVKPDVFIARASWMTYYEQSLGKQGLDSKGIDYKTHKLNEKAANYAQRMLDRQQNVSDADLSGKLFSEKNPSKQVMMKVFMPFASFRMNQSARLGADFATITSKVSTEEDRYTAARSLAGFTVEMVTFRALSTGISLLTASLVATMMGSDEEDEEKKKKSIIKGQATNTVSDIFSPIPFTDPIIQAIAATTLQAAQDVAGVDEEDMVSLYSPQDKGYLEQLGLFGFAAQRVFQTGELIWMSSVGSYRDSYGKKKYVSDDDKETLRLLIGPAILTNVGLAPSEMNSVIRASMSAAKKNSSTKEGGSSSGKDYESQMLDIMEEDLLEGYENKTELKRYNPRLYEQNFGERSEYYQLTKEKRAEQKKIDEEEQKEKDAEYGYKKDSKGFGSRSKSSGKGFGAKKFGKD